MGAQRELAWVFGRSQRSEFDNRAAEHPAVIEHLRGFVDLVTPTRDVVVKPLKRKVDTGKFRAWRLVESALNDRGADGFSWTSS